MILPRTYAHFLMSIKIPFMRFLAAVWPEPVLPLAPLRRPCSNGGMEPTLPSKRDDALVAPPSTAPTSLANSPEAGAGPDSASPSGSPVGRRIVLGMIGLGAVGVLVGRQAQEAITSTVSATVPGLGSPNSGRETGTPSFDCAVLQVRLAARSEGVGPSCE